MRPSIRASRFPDMSAPALAENSAPKSKGPARRALERFLANRAAIAGLALVVPVLIAVISYPLWWPHAPNEVNLLALNKPPSAEHWLGTDGVGRDVFSRLMQGGRTSMLVAVSSAAISLAAGFLIGAVAAFSGRIVDNIAMRFVDLMMTLPP